MKSFRLLIPMIFLLASPLCQAQEADSTLVRKAALGYIENFFENKVEAMNEYLHPRLAKRGLNPDRTLSPDYPPAELAKLMAKNPVFPRSAQRNKVTNIKVFRNSATAALVTGYPSTRWVEFLHLVKQDGKWKIINVFWEFFEKKER